MTSDRLGCLRLMSAFHHGPRPFRAEGNPVLVGCGRPTLCPFRLGGEGMRKLYHERPGVVVAEALVLKASISERKKGVLYG